MTNILLNAHLSSQESMGNTQGYKTKRNLKIRAVTSSSCFTYLIFCKLVALGSLGLIVLQGYRQGMRLSRSELLGLRSLLAHA